ncbi:MAG: choice-of-anchor L domain-containing protein, partial [Bacteroidota bacterium]
FTTATGSISQSFRVPASSTQLEVCWEFLSEEFLEYIGSQFQDRFSIVIMDEEGNQDILLSKTIDQMAQDFGASSSIAGSLTSVSPAIVFDRGGVYTTNWQASTFDISQYQGKIVTLTIAVGDVGDSIYDTAILLDCISLN